MTFRNCFSRSPGFTLIELLLVMVMIGILSSFIYLAVGNQREEARVTKALHLAEGVLAIAHECYFHDKKIPETIPGTPICTEVKTDWPVIDVEGCAYDPSLARSTGQPGSYDSYAIKCRNRAIICGVAKDNSGCKTSSF